jgi:tetratricopeptide (TPR) repeat protein
MKTPIRIKQKTLPVIILGLAICESAVLSECFSPDPDSLQKALLAEDWPRITALCQTEHESASPLVIRIIEGHALLARNENNRSLGSFLLLANPVHRQAWAKWTETFVVQNPSSHVAHYLRGDALARLTRWEQAVESYTQALVYKPSFSMAHNSLGVVHTRLGEFERALDDFERACHFSPDLADVYGSLGTFWLLREAPEGALTAFESAIARSTNFALALNGRACAKIGFSHDPTSLESALADLSLAMHCPYVKLLAQTNIHRILRQVQERGMDVRLGAMRSRLHHGDVSK